jgi:hypothetical protein
VKLDEQAGRTTGVGTVDVRLAAAWAAQLELHVGHIDGYFSFNGIYPAQNEHIIILANSESTKVLAISDTLAALTLSRDDP